MDIQLADVMVHIDEELDKTQRLDIETELRSIEGVVSVSNQDRTPHLSVIEYNPEKTSSQQLINCVIQKGVHAELIGL